MSDYLIREIDAAPNIDVRYGVHVADGTGTDRLESLVLEDTKTRMRESVPADGLFVLIGSQPRTEWLGDSLARDQWGFILTGQDVLDSPGARWDGDRHPFAHETSLPGVFAAGDVRQGAVKRIPLPWEKARSPSRSCTVIWKVLPRQRPQRGDADGYQRCSVCRVG